MRLITGSYLHRVISGGARGFAPAGLRVLLRIGEVFYDSATRLRNKLYDSGIRKIHRLSIPVISIGNITAGGTGKTPMVRYLAAGLAQRGFHPAILMRGYHRTTSGQSDEQALLSEQLRDVKIPVHADPNRVAGGHEILQNHPHTNVILLDDGFQHRRLFRDVDIILIDATSPFGFGHIHPRGLLRESLSGLCRATAIILTRCEQLAPPQLESIEHDLRSRAPSAPILRARFQHTALRSATTAVMPIESLKPRRIFAAAAIANPPPLESSLKQMTTDYRGHWWFPDHHDYTAADLIELRRRATTAQADTIIVTEKDWVKLRLLPGASDGAPPIFRLDLDIQLDPQDESQLWDLLTRRLHRPQQIGPAQPHNSGEDQNRQNHPDTGP